jgi:hypothetical protein
MSEQLGLEWLFVLAGFVLSLGAFGLLMLLRTERVRANSAAVEFVGEYAGGILLLALVLEIFGFLQMVKLFAPEQKIETTWLWATLLLSILPVYGIYRGLNFSETRKTAPAPKPRAFVASPSESAEFLVEERPAIADEWQVKIMEVMRNHSEGLSLVDLGEELGIDWRQLTVAARQLVHDRKLRKEGKFYYSK